jgi:hypothetical protein
MLLVYSVYVRQSTKLYCSLTTLSLIYDHWQAHDGTHIYCETIFGFRDVSSAELPVSHFLFKYSRNLQGTSDSLQTGFEFCNAKFKCVASTLDIHKFQDKLRTLSKGLYVNYAVY